MQGLRFYILIEDKEKESEVRMDGNLETLRVLLYALRAEFAHPTPITVLPTENMKPEQEGINVTH